MKEIDSIKRRTLLKGTAAATAVSVVGCASPLTTGSRPRVVVVGGGWGGLGAVRALAAGGKVDITLIEPNDDFMSCPLRTCTSPDTPRAATSSAATAPSTRSACAG